MATKTFPLLLIIEEGKDTNRVNAERIELVKVDRDRELLDWMADCQDLVIDIRIASFVFFSFALCEQLPLWIVRDVLSQ
jgi:hypothetical protein